VVRYGTSVSELAATFMGHASGLGRGYLTRRLLSLLEFDHGSVVWDAIPMETVESWHLNMRAHRRPLHKWTCGRVRRQFCMSPLQVSTVACSWGLYDEDVEACMVKAKASVVLSVARDLLRYEKAPSQDGMTVKLPWWPSSKELAMSLVTMTAEGVSPRD